MSRGYTLFMIVVTGLYLTIEIPFSVYLIDFLASASSGDLEQVEHVGRLLTGAAVAIFLVGSIVFPICSRRLPVMTTLLIATIVAVPTVKMTYGLLNEVGEVTGKHASGEARKNAYLTNISKRHLAENGFNGVEPTFEGDWQMFVSFLPALAGNSGEKLLSLTGVSIEQLAQAEAIRILGTTASFRGATFNTVFDNFRDSYKEYQSAGEKQRTAIDDVEKRAEKEWIEFLNKLEIRLGTKKSYSSYERSAIRQRAKEEGLNLPSNFNPNDKKTFIRIVSKKLTSEISKEYERAITRYAGGYVPPNLSYDAFLKHQTVQKSVRDAFQLSNISKLILPDMSDNAFEDAVYKPLLKVTSDEVMTTAQLKAEDFSQNTKYIYRGVQAVKSVDLPILAILLSLAGATLHLFKFSNYSLKLLAQTSFRPFKFLKLPFASVAIAATFMIVIAVLISFQGNRVAGIAIELAEQNEDELKVLILQHSLALQPEFSQFGNILASVGVWQIFKEITSLY